MLGLLKWNVVVGGLCFVVKGVVKGSRRRIFLAAAISTTTSSAAAFDFPGVEVDVVAPLVFVATDVEGDLEFVADADLVKLVDLIADNPNLTI